MPCGQHLFQRTNKLNAENMNTADPNSSALISSQVISVRWSHVKQSSLCYTPPHSRRCRGNSAIKWHVAGSAKPCFPLHLFVISLGYSPCSHHRPHGGARSAGQIRSFDLPVLQGLKKKQNSYLAISEISLAVSLGRQMKMDNCYPR